MFVSWWSNFQDQITSIIVGGNERGMLIFDANCIFIGADAICASATQAVFSGAPTSAIHAGEYAGLIEPVSSSTP